MPVWKTLHGLNHVDYSLKHVSNDFTLPESFSIETVMPHKTEDKYQQSIYMFAIIPMVIGILSLLLMLIWECIQGCRGCCVCRQNPSTESRAKMRLYAKCVRVCLIAVAAFAIGGSFLVGDRLNKSITQVAKHIDEFHTPFDEPVRHMNNITGVVTKFSQFGLVVLIEFTFVVTCCFLCFRV